MSTLLRKSRRILVWASIALLALVAVAVAVALAQSAAPYSAAEVRRLNDLLNESAATAVPHGSLMSKEARDRNAPLLARVESGGEMDAAAGAAYRRLYQSTLQENQSKLALFDPELTVIKDLAMDAPNNVGGHGVPGAHDHHDRSALANFEVLAESLERVEGSSGPFASLVRIRNANRAYKNLSDIVLHLGTVPHTVSVPLAPPSHVAGRDALAADFAAMLEAYKEAQFAPVNSPPYAAAVHRALGAYDRLVLATQARINARLGPLERRLAGRWLALHTLSPSPDEGVKVRFPREGAVMGEEK